MRRSDKTLLESLLSTVFCNVLLCLQDQSAADGLPSRRESRIGIRCRQAPLSSRLARMMTSPSFFEALCRDMIHVMHETNHPDNRCRVDRAFGILVVQADVTADNRRIQHAASFRHTV